MSVILLLYLGYKLLALLLIHSIYIHYRTTTNTLVL